MSIASNPSTAQFNVPGTQVFTFSIPSGSYTAGQWDIAGSHTPVSATHALSGPSPPAYFITSSGSSFSYSQALTDEALADVNNGAGGNITVTFSATSLSGTCSITSFTLTLTSGGSGQTIVFSTETGFTVADGIARPSFPTYLYFESELGFLVITNLPEISIPSTLSFDTERAFVVTTNETSYSSSGGQTVAFSTEPGFVVTTAIPSMLVPVDAKYRECRSVDGVWRPEVGVTLTWPFRVVYLHDRWAILQFNSYGQLDLFCIRTNEDFSNLYPSETTVHYYNDPVFADDAIRGNDLRAAVDGDNGLLLLIAGNYNFECRFYYGSPHRDSLYMRYCSSLQNIDIHLTMDDNLDLTFVQDAFVLTRATSTGMQSWTSQDKGVSWIKKS